jgi:hypothetical protein
VNIEGPDRFRITIHSDGVPAPFEIEGPDRQRGFAGRATTAVPKLYVVSVDETPIYVGITRQRMQARLRIGWSATGKHGYHGYQWRREYPAAMLDVWYQLGAPPGVEVMRDIETVEAEVVFLIRQAGQWPRWQTEIHFHESTAEHRAVAEAIWNQYRRGIVR